MEMIKNDQYCIDVLHQMQAVGSGLKKTENLLLENHLKTCAINAIRKGKTEEAIAEVMQVFKRSLR